MEEVVDKFIWLCDLFCGYLVYVGCDHLAYFMVIWYFFLNLVCCTKKNLASLVCMYAQEVKFQSGENVVLKVFAQKGLQ
jgi:hypothetical protein